MGLTRSGASTSSRPIYFLTALRAPHRSVEGILLSHPETLSSNIMKYIPSSMSAIVMFPSGVSRAGGGKLRDRADIQASEGSRPAFRCKLLS
ncbi:MAG: hypothetical protein ABWW65_01080 [Thermoprotei archaeon]